MWKPLRTRRFPAAAGLYNRSLAGTLSALITGEWKWQKRWQEGRKGRKGGGAMQVTSQQVTTYQSIQRNGAGIQLPAHSGSHLTFIMHKLMSHFKCKHITATAIPWFYGLLCTTEGSLTPGRHTLHPCSGANMNWQPAL